ncbi:polymorphic toxin-type HINT domain-containing protein [Amycolatopsis roodepoortensis]|uniref:Hint domain-containing protein n=1 Tax=Amycolatopsis roodepoortensis TaxID=700274 RepID=A0ABR9LKZ3_9PSEU|nr:polymorphic toxin-type HINT domain-containing protein [Amycolatopsis roodepoortensis]MBE1580960.1 hypothetical protein [Amycolatopsis roodepoortensis]
MIELGCSAAIPARPNRTEFIRGKKYAAAQQEKVKRGYNENSYKEAQAVVKKSKWDVFIDAAGELIKSLIGWDDIMGCIEGSVGSCISTLLNFIPWGKILKVGEIVASFWKGARALATFGREVEKAQKVIADTERILADAEMAANAVQVVVAVSEGDGVVGAAAAAMGGAAAASDSGCNSFVPGTQVLMSDGTTKPIEQVKLNDQVQATDPETGETTARKVVSTIVGEGQKYLVEISVAGGAPIVATDGHPFWAPDLRKWVPAEQLTVGSWLQTSSGTWAQVTAVRSFAVVASVHNLTVDDLHTYSVLAGAIAVLVHNAGGHACDITVSSPSGGKSDISLKSGSMTPEEASLGYPNNSAFTHTEHRFSRMAGASTGSKVSLPNDPFAGKFPLSAGDQVTMQGQLPPCSRCKGAMNRMVSELGVSVTYEWSGAKGSGSWTAGRRKR